MKQFIFTVVMGLSLLVATPAYAEESTMIKGHATAYCQTGTMASGKETRDGACASSREHLGKTIVVYQRLVDDSIGNYIGTFESLDTGGTKGLKNGTVVDVWKPNMDACQEFMDLVYTNGCQGRVYIQIIESEG